MIDGGKILKSMMISDPNKGHTVDQKRTDCCFWK